MAHLLVETPGEPPRRVPLGSDVVEIGRGEDVAVFIAEPKASRRHARLAPVVPGGWTLEDLDSSNGTWIGNARVARRRLVAGETFRIGDTRLSFVDDAESAAVSRAPTAPLVSGRVALRAIGSVGVAASPAPASAPSPAAAPAVEGESPPAGRDSAGRTRGALLRAATARRRLTQALLGLGLAGGLWLGAHLAIGGDAQQVDARVAVRSEALDVLAQARGDAAAFVGAVDDFAVRHPEAREAIVLRRHRLAALERRDASAAAGRVAETLLQRLAGEARADDRLQALKLLLERPSDEGVSTRLAAALDGWAARDEETRAEASQRRARVIDEAIADGRYHVAATEARIALARRGVLPPEDIAAAEAALQRTESAAAGGAERLHVALRALPEEERLERLLSALPHFQGTRAGRLLDGELRSALRNAGLPARTLRPGQRQPGAGTEVPDIPGGPLLALLARGREAMRNKQFTSAHGAFEELARLAAEGELFEDAKQQLADLALLLPLFNDFGARVATSPLALTLDGTHGVIVGANGDAFTFRPESGPPEPRPWAKLDANGVLDLLRPTGDGTEQRLGFAMLAAHWRLRAPAIEALAPLYAADAPVEARERADGLVARLLDGRRRPPEGGYRLHRGDLIEAESLRRLLAREETAKRVAEVESILAEFERDPAWQKLDKLRTLRAELDAARSHALLAIFNEKHYPYPANKSSKHYQVVQREIERRVAAVRLVWDNPLQVRVGRDASTQKTLTKLDALLDQLEADGALEAAVAARAWPWLAYGRSESLNVRTFFLDAGEEELLAYNEWVRAKLNPTRVAVAGVDEREQVAITNDYRFMMGFSALVIPGEAPYEGIDEKNVVGILDSGHVVRLLPLRAVRIDDRLVRAARGHSEDMMRRGFFDHHAPPNPYQGTPGSAPHDRMTAAGYSGRAFSENIATAPSALQAHLGWFGSSGHHRNLLSPWEDLGVGHMSRRWTQNFGSGAGGQTIIQPLDAAPPVGPSRGGGR